MISENPPIMLLGEETLSQVTFQFNGRPWALATLIPGLILLVVVINLAASSSSNVALLSILALLGVLLIYSSLYSLTSTQWLTADSSTQTIKFHKKNIYGLVDWEKPAGEFKAIKVRKPLHASNWAITIITNDGYRIQIGENIFGALNYEKALEIAHKVSSRTGIKLDAPDQKY